MTCQQTRALLAEFTTDALSRRRQAAVSQHVAGCAECRAELAALRSVGSLLDAMPPAEAHPELWQGIEARLTAAQPVRRPSPRLVWVGAAAAAAVALFLIWPTTSRPAPTSEFLGQHHMLAGGGLLANGALSDVLMATSTTEEPRP